MTTLHEQYIVDNKGKKSAVILPIDEYHNLLEDLHDLAVVAKRKDQGTINLNEIKHRMKKNNV